MSEWQPIGTAPRDGTGFIYFQPVGERRIIDAGYWDGYEFRAVDFFRSEDPLIEPTHWMPLPSPPAIEGARGMSEMLEKVARAMCEADGFKWDAASCLETGNGEEPEEQRIYWRDKAEAAVRALREPDRKMFMAADDALVPAFDALACWRAMIDSILPTTRGEVK